jgi:hypothetical protein
MTGIHSDVQLFSKTEILDISSVFVYIVAVYFQFLISESMLL